jgi:hypothetical protein
VKFQSLTEHIDTETGHGRGIMVRSTRLLESTTSTMLLSCDSHSIKHAPCSAQHVVLPRLRATRGRGTSSGGSLSPLSASPFSVAAPPRMPEDCNRPTATVPVCCTSSGSPCVTV